MGEPTRRRLTLAEAIAIDDASPVPLEFVDGRLYYQGVEVDVSITPIEDALRNMAPASPRHAELGVSVLLALQTALRATASGCKTYTSELRVYLPDGRYVHPDACVVCGPIVPPLQDGLGVTNPSVLVEVLSPSTEGYDRGEKFERAQGIPSLQHYVLVSQRKARVDVYTRSGDAWTLRSYGMDDALRLEALGLSVPVRSIYEGVELDPVEPPEVLTADPKVPANGG
jgi:Uma2 family endonuclease